MPDATAAPSPPSALGSVLAGYAESFRAKVFEATVGESDVLMDVFGVTPQMKAANAQFWGRELGMCWQRLVTDVFRTHCRDYRPGIQVGADEPCDQVVGLDAIDTKYRIGSGDSGTLKKLAANGQLLAADGYRPIMLILREDNLPAAISKVRGGGWTVLTGAESLAYILRVSGYDLEAYLAAMGGAHRISR